MKTPEEIKKLIDYCYQSNPCSECSYNKKDFPECVRRVYRDAYECITHQEKRITELEERINLNDLRDAIYEDAVAHGLLDDEEDYMPTDCVCLIKDEVNDLDCAAIDFEDDIINDNSAFCDELADVIIMCLSVAGKLGIDIDAEVKSKMEINKGRQWKHWKEEQER